MEDAKTVHYVTQDPMSNLKLKVTLTRLSATKSKQQEQQGSAAAGSAAAEGAGSAQDTVPGSRPTGRPAPFQVARTFSWQEKVYSKAELVAAQAQLRANQQQGTRFSSPKRTAHFGSQSHIGTDRLLTASPEGSILFSYVQTDDFCEKYETSRSITTSKWEGQNHLANKLLTDPRNRQKMLNFHAMFIMADLGNEHTVAGSNEKVLCVIRAHRDGSFDMTPGFSTPGQRIRFEDDHGGMYEYIIEPASRSAAPCLEKRAAKLAGAVAAQVEEIRRQANRMDLTPPPGPDGAALRLLLMAELVSAAGFQRDRLYVEWQLQFDPELWVLQHSEQEVVQPGLIQGVTHVSQMVQYPADCSTDTPALWVAHFAHPIEVEWIAKEAPTPKDWPRMLLQVRTYDLWDRVTTEGYGWLQLGGICPGSSTHYVDTWRPLGTRRDQQQAWFIGGSEELEDMSYVAVPKGHKGRLLNKYGYKTETSGTIKVRLHSVVQTATAAGSSPRKTAANKWPGGNRQHRDLSLAVVLERAHARLREARGGDVAVRQGVVSQRPVVTVQPSDVSVNEGGTAQFSVTATGLPPLRYQWYKDSKRLTVATSDTPLLILVDVGVADSGTYYCQVSNKDGAVSSAKALLSITRIGHLQRATGGVTTAATGEADSSSGDGAASMPSLSNTLNKRTTIPRSLARGGGGLPYSPRFSTRSGSSSAAPSGTSSPLRASLGSLSPVRGRAGFRSAAGDGDAAEDGSSARQRMAAAPAGTAGAGAAGGWASASVGSPLRRSSHLAAQQQSLGPQQLRLNAQQQQHQDQQQHATHEDLAHHLPPSTWAAQTAAPQPVQPEASTGGLVEDADVLSGTSSAVESLPVKPDGNVRRARVSQQH